ncbi:hypothetical protein [Mycolicibacterium sp. A43C]
MAVSVADVESFTKGRLKAVDPEVIRLFDAALAEARNYCGWPVTLIEDDVIELDGPGRSVLALPTRKIVTLTSLVEEGISLNVDTLEVSKSMGTVKKPGGANWSGRYGSIVATMTHGHQSAPDFDLAVLMCVDAVALSVGMNSAERGTGGALTRKRVDDVEYAWTDRDVAEALDTSRLDSYRRLIFT